MNDTYISLRTTVKNNSLNVIGDRESISILTDMFTLDMSHEQARSLISKIEAEFLFIDKTGGV